jgi:5'-deoxynucleotidase YfbR-like HD superfamily hydrolase
METSAELYKRVERELYIETVKGEKFFIDKPVFDIETIAHALGNQCRYTGHVRKFYSVAEHSVLVADIMHVLKLGNPFEGLMHDAAEAYLSDIAAPWKVLLPDYKVLEAKIEKPLRKFYGVPELMGDGVKRADWLALFIEAQDLMVTGAKDWTSPEGVKEQAIEIAHLFPIHAYSPGMARKVFLRRYAELTQ